LSSEQGQPLQLAAAKPERRQLFISYSHRDAEWVERLRRMIKPLEQRYGLERWDDSRIQAGGLWRQEIEQALASASVALLLVSADFLASDFVTLSELPPLFRAAKQEGLRILWLPLRPSLWKHFPEIEQYQAVIPPERTLAEMAAVEQERAFVQIAELILSTFREQEERLARLKKEEAELLAREREAEEARLALERQAEVERLERERLAQEQKEAAELEREALERQARERQAREQEAQERQAEQERLAREGEERRRQEAERLEAERQAREQAEIQARAEAERWKAEAERLARVNQALERRAQQEQAARELSHSAKNDRQERLQRYELEFRRAINAQYPLDSYAIDGLRRFQQQLELDDQDVAKIKESLIGESLISRPLIVEPLIIESQMAAKRAEDERKQAEQQQPLPLPQRQAAVKRVLGPRESPAIEQKQPQLREEQSVAEKSQINQVRPLSGPFSSSLFRPLFQPFSRQLSLRPLSRRQLLISAATAVPVVALGINALKQQQNRAELTSYSVNTGWLARQGDRWEKKTKPIEVQAYQQKLAPGVVLTMVEIPAGTFLMGSPPGEEGRDIYASLDSDLKKSLGIEGRDAEAQRRVTVPAFWIARFPITQAQWKLVARLGKIERELNADPSNFKGPERPVENVSWQDAIEFCRRLSKLTKRNYTLPSEAQWEYACRAGTTTPFHFGETLITELANYDGNDTYGQGPQGAYRQQTTNVGSFPANAWGLQDMHGNVWEWCLDRWHPSLAKAPTDGSAWQEPAPEVAKQYQDQRLLRGGSWYVDPGNCRSASRHGDLPDDQHYDVGFRVCCLPQGPFLYS
jgi:formylglycine-generating enzyme required for sulfatase activity